MIDAREFLRIKRDGGTHAPETIRAFVAEYLALTQLQADAFICLDPALVRAIGGTVPVAGIHDLISG